MKGREGPSGEFLQGLRGVLGPHLSYMQLKKLWTLSGGRMDDAVLLYMEKGETVFSMPDPKSSLSLSLSLSSSSSLSSKSSKVTSTAGPGVVDLVKGENAKRSKRKLNTNGSPLFSKRARKAAEGWPKELQALAVDAESTARLDASEVQELLCPEMSLNVSFDSMKKKNLKKSKKATIVRISANDVFLGRLPLWLSSSLHPLLEAGFLQVEANLQPFVPEKLDPLSQIPMILKIWVKGKEIFDQFPGPKDISEGLSEEALSFFNLLQALQNPVKFGSFSINGMESEFDQLRQGAEKNLSQQAVKDLNNSLGARSVDGFTDDPSGLLVTLRPHQKTALKWMLEREEGGKIGTNDTLWEKFHFNDAQKTPFFVNFYTGRASFASRPEVEPLRGGILADEMGLGKTISILALLLAKKEESGATLIVCPTSLLGQWEQEIKSKVKKDLAFRTYRFHGQDRAKAADLKHFDVIFTTYGTVTSEHSKGNSPILETKWKRIVLDEAHYVRHRVTDNAKAVASIDAEFRWCLTGTPLQNSVDDLFSLFCFLRHEPWNSFSWWSKVIKAPFEQTQDRDKSKAAMKRLKSVLNDGPVMLRRTKKQLEDEGQSLKDSIPKLVKVVQIEFAEFERKFYDQLYERSKAEFEGFIASGMARRKYTAIFTLLLRLRQACDHPFLVNERSSASLESDHAERLSNLRKRVFAAAGLDMRKLEEAEFLSNALDNVDQMEECPICLETLEKAMITTCGHIMCRDCLEGSFVYGGEMICPICRKHMTRLDMFALPKRVVQPENDGNGMLDNNEDSKATLLSSKQKVLLKDLHEIREINKVLSSKSRAWKNEIQKECAESLLGPSKGQQPIKVLVFSQWTKMLDLMEKQLNQNNFKFVRLDGCLPQRQRDIAIEQFNQSQTSNIFLISLKAGGVGLNLTSASVVYLLDAWWNPKVEEQAIDRVHRIGQTRPVFVNRLVIASTVEEKILALQQKKAQIAAEALSESTGLEMGTSQQRLSMEDLIQIFH